MSRVNLDEILELPAKDRVEIAQLIWQSVSAHPESISLTQAQRDELERRWQAFERSPDEGESWDDVKRSLLSE
jgi:putative addiction module component (TIGR02574 family)